MNLGRAINNLRQKKIRSEAFYIFAMRSKMRKKAPFWASGITMTERGRSIRSLGCDVRGVTCCRVLECFHNIIWTPPHITFTFCRSVVSVDKIYFNSSQF